MPYRRSFTSDFKAKVVQDFLHGGRSVTDLCREFQLSRTMIYRWRDEHLAAEQVASEPPAAQSNRQLREAQRRIEELEGALGRKTMEVDFLQRCLRRAGLPFAKAPKA